MISDRGTKIKEAIFKAGYLDLDEEIVNEIMEREDMIELSRNELIELKDSIGDDFGSDWIKDKLSEIIEKLK